MGSLVSIIIPVYNREDLIQETLNSVRDQEYQNWECLVIDDGSTDKTCLKVAEYCRIDSRIQLISRPNSRKKGAATCRNIGIENAKGEFVQFLDSDDLLHHAKISSQLNKAGKKRNTVVTGKWGYFVTRDKLYGRFKYTYKTYRNFRRPYRLFHYFEKYEEFFPIHVYLIPTAIIEKSGKWNEDLTNNDDAEFMVRVLIQATSIKFTAEAVVFYRIENENKLSHFFDKSRILDAFTAFDLIEKKLSLKSKKLARSYTDRLKTRVLNDLKRNYPEIDRKEFFMNFNEHN